MTNNEQRQRIKTTARVDIIDARVRAGFVGHSYFYSHPAVSADLILLLLEQYDPGSPGRPLRKRGVNFWEITKEYPAPPGANSE